MNLPVQARSKTRREAILDAAAHEFDARGVAGTSMEAIARRAQSSIGAVYRYFPDRQTLFAALAERCLARSKGFFDKTVTSALGRLPWRKALAQTVGAYAAFYRSDLSFRAVWRNLTWAENYLKADLKLRQRYGQSVGEVLRVIQPRLKPARARRVGAFVVEITTSVLMVDAQAAAEPLFDELTTALERYLAPELRTLRVT